MANNVTVTIGADAAKLRAELAIATTEWRNYSREMNAAAREAVRTGSELSRATTGQAAANVNRMTAEISRLKDEMAELGKGSGGFVAIHEGVEGALASVSSIRGAFRELAETMGAALAVEKLVDWTRETAETAEHIGNMSTALGLSIEEYSGLSGAMRLATGDAEGMDRALLLLEERAQRALSNPEGAEMDAFRKIGFDAASLKESMSDLPGMLRKVADAYKEMSASPAHSAVFGDIFGVRQLANIAPLIKNGSDGIDELVRKAHELGNAWGEDVNKKLDTTAEKIHALSAAWVGVEVSAISKFSDLVSQGLDSLTDAATRLSGMRGLFSPEHSGPRRHRRGEAWKLRRGSWSGPRGRGGRPIVTMKQARHRRIIWRGWALFRRRRCPPFRRTPSCRNIGSVLCRPIRGIKKR
jgi:TP901 family phage tail tape measure protein